MAAAVPQGQSPAENHPDEASEKTKLAKPRGWRLNRACSRIRRGLGLLGLSGFHARYRAAQASRRLRAALDRQRVVRE